MADRYASASEVVRNLAQIRVPFEVLEEQGKFRLVQFVKPFFDGFEFWIVNEKGFMWEPCVTLDQALAYLASDEAADYNKD